MAQHYSMTPSQVAAIDDPADIRIMIEAAEARVKDQWRHTLAIAQAIVNWGGPRTKEWRPKKLGHMYDVIFGGGTPVRSKAQLSAVLSAISKRKE